ncbi:MAG: phosphoribosylanthranilate isomerase [Pseudomonadales bacterium]
MITRIKICGITRQRDADAAVHAGVDAIGLNFAPVSPRRVDVATAARIAASVGTAVKRVGLFVDPAPAEVVRVLDQVELDVLQFHGDESGDFCRSFDAPFMKVLRVREPLDMAAIEGEYAGACCLLLDAFVPGVPGGTGQRFDPGLWPAPGSLPLVLAGGLTPDNVAQAIRRLAPWGVDVSGGVEGPRKGEKDQDRIEKFVSEVKRARS